MMSDTDEKYNALNQQIMNQIERTAEQHNIPYKTITGDDIAKMEYEMGEWIVDIVDVSLYFNRPEVRERYYKHFDKKYPELMKLVYKYIEEDKHTTRDEDIAEVIHNLSPDTISEDDYHKLCAEIYNIDDIVNKAFWIYWIKYEIDNRDE